jgi:hypothetical protein
MRSIATRRPVRHAGPLLAAILVLALALGLLVTLPPRSAGAATCPCTIFTATQVPENPAENDTDAVELGVKFRADQPGFVTGIRFYKGTGNGGTHTGSLWQTDGTRLATVTFTGESATGWQQAAFASPVAVAAGTTYIASYFAPTGRYAADANYYATTGVTNSPLSALQNGVDGGNGVYRYGVGGGFPSSSFQSSNYWVDVVFNSSGADATKPTVTDRQPLAGATGVPATTAAAATFSEAVLATTIQMTLRAGTATTDVAGTTTYDANTRTATLTPSSSLAASTTYAVNVSAAQDTAGNPMDPVSWTFTTAAAATGCPCTTWASTTVPATAAAADSSAVELGVKFRASQSGFITGIRFYKGAGNTGTHLGSLWNRAGAKLASVTFTGETATGWQGATFGSPVPVTAGTTYVASYHAPVGRYAANSDYFAAAATTRGPLTALRDGTDGPNGVYRYGGSGFPSSTFRSSNYWVDVVFASTATDTTAPTVVAQAPAPGSSGAASSTPVTATFSEAVGAASVAVELRGPGGALVAGNVSYSSGNQTATLTPSSPLATSTTYSVAVSGAQDGSGNTMSPVSWSFSTAAPPPPPPEQGPGGPIAVVTSSANPYSKYLAEILRTEGLNEFSTIDVGTLSPSTLGAYDAVVLGNVTVSPAQVTALASWVDGGGNLVALRPSSELAGLLGITPATGTVSDGYLKVDPATVAGAGIVSETMQYHGAADRYSLSGADAVAALYSNATTATSSPAVTLRSVGTNGGQAAAFTYDLARSVVQLRQGNPAWATLERDGQAPIRSDDKFFGGTASDWVDLTKIPIPQADEQQRLLANLLQVMNRDKKPLPRFWYFPRDLKAVVVATGDDHGNGGTAGRFDQYNANSPAGCSGSNPAGVADWTCLRFSSYVYPNTPLSNAAALAYANQGFEVGVHPSTGCGNYSATSIADTYTSELASWKSNYPGLRSPATNRLHCIVFSDWASQPKTELANGIRLDTNYYYWPSEWIQNRPGFMTGSGMPMRFTDTDGSMLNIYQAVTQMTDESGQSYPLTPNALLDNALGPNGYYGAFTANMHTDLATIPQDDALIASAKERNVPIISGQQLLTWTDGRNGSSFGDLTWNANQLSFSVSVGAGANGLTGMLPTAGPGGTQLTTLTRAGAAVPFTRTSVKGQEYASFAAAGGGYTAGYAAAAGPPTITATEASVVQARTADEASIAWATSEPATSEVAFGTAPDALTSTKKAGGARRKHEVRLTGLQRATTYYFRVTSRDTAGNVRTEPAADQSPAKFTTPALDNTPPVVSSPVVSAMPDGTATISWTTREKADSVVDVGPSAARLDEQRRDDELVLDHNVVLTDLAPDRTYVARLSSTDAAGNTGPGRVVRFVTPARGVAEHATAGFERGTLSGSAVVDPAGLGSVTLAPGTAARAGTFVSGVLDARVMADWERAVWTATTPARTGLTIGVRTGSTAVPDSSWSEWTTVGRSGGRVRGSSRFIQYRVEMTAAAASSPALQAIGFSHNGVPPVPPKEGS